MSHGVPVLSGRSKRMTVEEWGDLPEDVPGELVDGRLVEDEMTDFSHETVVAFLLRLLLNWTWGTDSRTYGSEGKLRITDDRGRKADITVYLDGRRPEFEGIAYDPPDIAVEVVSRSRRHARRDRVEKVDDYAFAKIRHYWIVDPWSRTLEVFELGADGRYVRVLGAAEGTLDSIPGCEGLVVDLDALWRELDDLKKRKSKRRR